MASRADGADAGAQALAARRRWYEEDEAGRSFTAAVTAAEARLSGLQMSRLSRIARLFGLSPHEIQLLMVAVAPQVEPKLAQLYEALQNRPWATEALASDLFDWGRAPLWNAGAPLAAWDLVAEGRPVPGEPPALSADPAVRFWLAGQFAGESALSPRLTLVKARSALAGWPVDECAERARALTDRGHSVRLIVEGLPGAGRATFAASVSKAVGLSCLAVATEADVAEPSRDVWMRAQRAALVVGAALVWRGAWAAARWPELARPAPLQALVVEPGTTPAADERFVDQRMCTAPALAQRARTAPVRIRALVGRVAGARAGEPHQPPHPHGREASNASGGTVPPAGAPRARP